MTFVAAKYAQGVARVCVLLSSVYFSRFLTAISPALSRNYIDRSTSVTYSRIDHVTPAHIRAADADVIAVDAHGNAGWCFLVAPNSEVRSLHVRPPRRSSLHSAIIALYGSPDYSLHRLIDPRLSTAP